MISGGQQPQLDYGRVTNSGFIPEQLEPIQFVGKVKLGNSKVGTRISKVTRVNWQGLVDTVIVSEGINTPIPLCFHVVQLKTLSISLLSA